MADIKDSNFVVSSLIEEFDLKDSQPIDMKQFAEMIGRSQELYQEKSKSDKDNK